MKDRSSRSGFSLPPATRAARSAPHCSSGISSSTTRDRPIRTMRRRGACWGRTGRRRIEQLRPRSGSDYATFGDEAELLDEVTRHLGGGEDHRMVLRTDGVRPPCSRCAQHPGRPAIDGDAERDESAHQVPRELPPVRALRPRGGGVHGGSISSPGRRARTCSWSRR